MFRFTDQAYYCALLELCLLKQSVKIRHYEYSVVMWLHNYWVLLVCAVRGTRCTAYSTYTNRTE